MTTKPQNSGSKPILNLLNEKQEKEIEIIIDHFYRETQRLVNKLTEKIFEFTENTPQERAVTGAGFS